jgi:hypothetical protein
MKLDTPEDYVCYRACYFKPISFAWEVLKKEAQGAMPKTQTRNTNPKIMGPRAPLDEPDYRKTQTVHKEEREHKQICQDAQDAALANECDKLRPPDYV